MATTLSPREVINQANELKNFWSPRPAVVKSWYELLMQKDNLAKEQMESFVGNDPRTFYNLAMYLLTRPKIPHAIPTEGLNPIQIRATSDLERFVTNQWKRHDRLNRGAGRGRWVNELVSLLLTTGWYSIFAPAHENGTYAEIWHPLETFPEFDSQNPMIGDISIQNLTRVAHWYKIDVKRARRKIAQLEWDEVNMPAAGSVDLIDYWFVDEDNVPVNVIVINNQISKQETRYDNLPGIPVICGCVGGLPDRGTIIQDNTWKAHVGESILATNEKVLNSYNKQMTFIVQMLRDFAQTRWYQKTADGKTILTAQNIFQRGAIFNLGLQDEVGMITPPGIPVETRTTLFDTRGMIQRGGFPDAMFGNLQQQMSASIMTQIADSAQQVLSPFHDGTMIIFEDIDNLWLWQLKNGLTIRTNNTFSYSISADVPSDSEFEVDYKIEIPGALIAKATVGRMLNPTFRLSNMKILDMLFPEIGDPTLEYSKALADESLMHPIARAIDLYKSFRDQAQLAEQGSDPDAAELYYAAANTIRQQITSGSGAGQQPQQQGRANPNQQEMARQEAMVNNPTEEGIM